MFQINESENVVAFTISSEMRLVDRVIRESAEFLKQLGIDECKDIKLVLRELLINAIEHGNLNIIERPIDCRVEHIAARRFKVVVEDAGEGFDSRKLDLSPPQNPRQVRNRGYVLVNAMADEIEFNDKGNRITAYLTIPQETSYSVAEKDGFQVIAPSGDLTASTADLFRSTLIDLTDKGYDRFCFDFKQVEDIDSISLSVLILFANIFNNQDKKVDLRITNANKDLVRLFQMTKTDGIYAVNS